MSTPQHLLELLDKADKDERGLPPIHQWQPARHADIDMRIARDGTWYYEGSPIQRERMVRLFSTILLHEGDDYFLITPVEKLRISVDDAPFVATLVDRVDADNGQRLIFTTNVDSHVVAGPAHPITVHHDSATGEPAPYVLVRDNLRALIHRRAFYNLVDMATEKDGHLMVESAGMWFDLGAL